MGICKNSLTTNHRCINSSRCTNNVPITCVVQKDSKGKIISKFETNKEEPLLIPPVVMAAPEKKKESSNKVINVEQNGEAPMPMPSIVGRKK